MTTPTDEDIRRTIRFIRRKVGRDREAPVPGSIGAVSYMKVADFLEGFLEDTDDG